MSCELVHRMHLILLYLMLAGMNCGCLKRLPSKVLSQWERGAVYLLHFQPAQILRLQTGASTAAITPKR